MPILPEPWSVTECRVNLWLVDTMVILFMSLADVRNQVTVNAKTLNYLAHSERGVL